MLCRAWAARCRIALTPKATSSVSRLRSRSSSSLNAATTPEYMTMTPTTSPGVQEGSEVTDR